MPVAEAPLPPRPERLAALTPDVAPPPDTAPVPPPLRAAAPRPAPRPAEIAAIGKKIEELEAEEQALKKQLLQALDMDGKLKKIPDETKRQANAVYMAISRSIKKIDQIHPSLGKHIRNTIKTGEYLSYTPEKDISWITIQ